MKNLFLLLAILTPLLAKPCGNEYGHTLDGRKMYTRYFYLTDRDRTFDTTLINERIENLRKQIASGTYEYKHLSDLAVNLMKMGKVDEARKLLVPLVKKKPDEYRLVANLGTVYELTGQLDSALKYILLGYQLNPKSHRGTEWIHIKILEAKINVQNDRHNLWTHRILPVDSLEARASDRQSITSINRALFYQIRTRVPFTPAPNAVIRNLLLSLGDLNRKHGTYEDALLAYAYAHEFGANYRDQNETGRLIEDLNNERAALKDLPPLHPRFVKMMQRSKISPEILVLGLPMVAHDLDSIDSREWAMRDSLNAFATKTDSLDQHIAELRIQIESSNSKYPFPNFLWLLLTGIGGGILVWLLMRKRQPAGNG